MDKTFKTPRDLNDWHETESDNVKMTLASVHYHRSNLDDSWLILMLDRNNGVKNKCHTVKQGHFWDGVWVHLVCEFILCVSSFCVWVYFVCEFILCVSSFCVWVHFVCEFTLCVSSFWVWVHFVCEFILSVSSFWVWIHFVCEFTLCVSLPFLGVLLFVDTCLVLKNK